MNVTEIKNKEDWKVFRRYWKNVLKHKFFPYQYDPQKFQDTFLSIEHDYPPVDFSREIPAVIWVFWTGDNPLTPNRERALSNLRNRAGLPVELITPSNLSEYILPEFPLHPAYEFLSLVHKSDYLRCYFMHHYGGGYSDIKSCRHDWRFALTRLQNSQAYAFGYPEKMGYSLAQVGGILQQEMQSCFSQIMGANVYIFRAKTPFTYDWYHELHRRLDQFLPQLQGNPQYGCQTGYDDVFNSTTGYPIKWTEILGNIFHPLCLKYMPHLLLDTRLRTEIEEYR